MIVLLVALTAFVAGALNAAAGGGTFLTFPLLTGVARLTEKAANVTSTIGLWPGTASSVVAAWPELRKIPRRVLAGYAAVGFVGGAGGALLLLKTPSSAFSAAVPWLLGFATIVFASGRRIATWAGRGEGPSVPRFTPRVLPLLLIISLYNGYFGAGGGILLIAGLSLAGLHDLRQMNALKVVIQTTSNASAVIAFTAAGVDWRLAGAMAVASFAGGYVGMAAARRVPQSYVRALVLLMGVTLTVAYFVKTYR
jgi:uncharacterized membrane protein YfcA